MKNYSERRAASSPRAPRPPQAASRKPVVALVVAILLLIAIPAAMACPACYGDPNSAITKGASNGVWFMLGIVGFVQIGFLAMFIGFWRRSRALQRVRDRLRVIEGGQR